jgi:hypothetical protein
MQPKSAQGRNVMTSAGSNPANDYRLIGPSEDGTVSNLLEGLSAKDSRQRLQALIGEWLRMENLVVVTGSGASVDSGGKTMDTLENVVLQTVAGLADTPTSLKGILRSRLLPPVPGTPRISFEDWLSYIVNAYALGSTAGSPVSAITWGGGASPSTADLEWAVKWIGHAIFAECALILSDATPGVTGILPHLAFLAKLVARDSNLGRAHLFTLNYDTLFEQALEILGIQYFDGFTGRADARFDPSVYGLDIYYPGEVAEGRVRRFDKFLHFYKLHGSIHWRVIGDELRARHPDLTPFKGYGDLPVVEKINKLPGLTVSLPSIGILPTANKFAQTLTMPFAHLFRSLQMRLSAPQTFLLVLGYGFSDDHVTRILETALMNPSLVMLVVEPNTRSATIERVRRYKDLGKRAFVLTATNAAFTAKAYNVATFGDFVRNIMPDIQWLEDFLRLRQFEKKIQASGLGDEANRALV